MQATPTDMEQLARQKGSIEVVAHLVSLWMDRASADKYRSYESKASEESSRPNSMTIILEKIGDEV